MRQAWFCSTTWCYYFDTAVYAYHRIPNIKGNFIARRGRLHVMERLNRKAWGIPLTIPSLGYHFWEKNSE